MNIARIRSFDFGELKNSKTNALLSISSKTGTFYMNKGAAARLGFNDKMTEIPIQFHFTTDSTGIIISIAEGTKGLVFSPTGQGGWTVNCRSCVPLIVQRVHGMNRAGTSRFDLGAEESGYWPLRLMNPKDD